MFDLGRNTTTLSKFIGCIDLIDVHQISPKHPRNNYDKGIMTKENVSGNFDI